MRAGWNGAPEPVFPPSGFVGRLRIVARGGVAIVATALFFAAFLVLRGADHVVSRIRGAPSCGFAPWAVRIWAGVAVSLLGLKVRVAGTPVGGPGALVANHAGWVDVVVLQRVSRADFVSKAEVAGWPIIGVIGRAIGTVFIERRPVEAKRQNVVLKDRLRRGDLICLFPEGTSTDGRQVLAFNSSLFDVFMQPDLRWSVQVQPVSLRYRPREGLPEALYAWWGEMAFGAHLGHVLAVSTGGTVDVRFHEPLRPGDFADRKALAARAGSVVAVGFQELEPISSEPR